MTRSKVLEHNIRDLMILPFSFNDLEVTALDIREEQKATIEYITGMDIELYEYGYSLLSKAADSKTGHKIAWSAISENTVEACSGIIKVSEGVYEAWAFFGRGFRKYSLPIARAIKNEVDNLDFVRLQAYADSDFKTARRFLEFLGFKKEAELKHYYGKDKHVIVYSIIKES